MLEDPLSGGPVLQGHRLSKRFGGLRAVNDVNVSVKAGEIVSVIGPNGAGKTTLFNILAGSQIADSGNVFLDGEDVTRFSALKRARKGLARSFQLVESFESMTTRETLITACLLRADLHDARERADDLLDALGLSAVANKRPSELSLASAKLLELGKCLATSPKLLLLDEMMSGLTLAEAERPMSIIRDLRDSGVGVLLTEHVMPIVMQLSDRLIVMSFGEKIVDGPPSEAVNDERVRSAYLGTPST